MLGSDPPPPPARQVGQPQPTPPSRHGDQGGGGGGWANGLPCHPPSAKQFSSRPGEIWSGKICTTKVCQIHHTGRGEIPRGGFSAGKIPYFNLVRNFPLIFRGEVRNFPGAEFCPCKPPYHRMPCASPRAPICFVPALLQVLSTNREGGAGSRIICEWRATPSTQVI